MRLELVLVCVALAAPLALGQTGQADDQRRQLRDRFEATGLKPGSPFPERDVFDAEGNRFNTRSLKGKYTVIVNGCLT